MRKGFNFPYTCPTINKALRSLEWIIDQELSSLSKTDLDIGKLSKTLYKEIESIFEDVRITNVEMREAANSQILYLEDEVENLREEVNTLSAKVEELERTLDLATRNLTTRTKGE